MLFVVVCCCLLLLVVSWFNMLCCCLRGLMLCVASNVVFRLWSFVVCCWLCVGG